MTAKSKLSPRISSALVFVAIAEPSVFRTFFLLFSCPNPSSNHLAFFTNSDAGLRLSGASNRYKPHYRID
jgi:hypothetical protein